MVYSKKAWHVFQVIPKVFSEAGSVLCAGHASSSTSAFARLAFMKLDLSTEALSDRFEETYIKEKS